MKKIAMATAVAAGLLVSAQPASAQYCVAGILFAAFYANATENRELSAKEASTCGLFYGADRDKAVRGGPPPGHVSAAPARTAARTAPKPAPRPAQKPAPKAKPQ